MINKSNVDNLGFIDEELDVSLDLVEEIGKLKKQKNAVVLAHYYENSEIQDIADFVGDSLALSQKASEINTSIIVFAGVKFMAETAKILSPKSKVLLPDLNAGCSLAESCNYADFKKFIQGNPGYRVVTYVNTSAAVKSLSDICCTSSNAVKVINSIPRDVPIIFAPDKNLGGYLKAITGRENMLIWDGACHVHSKFSLEKLVALKKEHSNAKVIAHPECTKPILLLADFIGSTAELLNFTKSDDSKEYIVVTEAGILHQMVRLSPEKTYIPAPPDDSTCGCSECSFMKLITLKKLYLTLKYEKPEISLDSREIELARLPIEKMLALK
ncbi:MAG: quinolinate synthase NadA [Bacteroidales bacterium]